MPQYRGSKKGLYSTESHILYETVMLLESKLSGRKKRKFDNMDIVALNKMIIEFGIDIENFFESLDCKEEKSKTKVVAQDEKIYSEDNENSWEGVEI